MTPTRRALSRTAAIAAIALVPLVAAATVSGPALAQPATATTTATAATTTATTTKTTASAPGDIVSARRINAPGFGYARVWQIQYLSTDTHGNSITVSGTVAVPASSYNGNRPIVGYAPGTHGLGDQCAPSRHLEDGDDQEGGLIHQYGWRGFAVAITDYEGLGTPGDHRYMVARSAGNVLLDIVRAAQRLTDAGLSKSAPVALVGYSQGGHAASWGAQLAGSYAPELNVKGVAAGGTPANLRQVADYNSGRPNFGLVLAAGIGMDAAYPSLELESYLNDAGRAGIEQLRNSCDFSPYANKTIDDYTTSNPLATPQWQSTLDAQNVGGVAPRMPVLLYHSTSDEIIPYRGARTLRTQWCGAGVKLSFWTFYFLEHAATAAWASPDVTSWVADRLAGKAAGSNC
ncbi:MAG: lipase family protein [Micromonosporaceae bacterium]